MVVLFRLLYTFVVSWLRPKIKPHEVAATPFRVWPVDFDIYRHLNNGRYLSLMDVARLDLIIRMRLVPGMFRKKWYPVVGAASRSVAASATSARARP